MTTKKFSELTRLSAVALSAVVPVVQSGTNYSATIQVIKDAVGGGDYLPLSGGDITGNVNVSGTVSTATLSATSDIIITDGVYTSFTSSRDIANSDNGKILLFTGALSATLNGDLNPGFQCGFAQTDSNQTTFLSAGGSTVGNYDGSTKTQGQYAMGTIIRIAPSIYITAGQLS